MRQFNLTDWKYSNVEEQKRDPIIAGDAILHITDANFDEETSKYKLTVENLTTGQTIFLSYNLEKVTETGQVEPNRNAERNLVSLGKALYGQAIGIPHPNDVRGGVVQGEIKVSKFTGDDGIEREWPACYKFDPVDKDMVESYSDLEQYYVGMEDEVESE